LVRINIRNKDLKIDNLMLSFLTIFVLIIVSSIIFMLGFILFRFIYISIKHAIYLNSLNTSTEKDKIDSMDISENNANKDTNKEEKKNVRLPRSLARQVFPALLGIDYRYKSNNQSIDTHNHKDLFLKEFVEQFQSFLANKNLYFDLNILRAYIAGLNSSRVILLEGLSGTGKSTLPRMFNEFTNGAIGFYPVQATWRDRTDIVGYYSDFTKKFKETEFLKQLYEANYNLDKINTFVLDEMNISRVEYYFADFLSILEYPKESWLVPLVSSTAKLKSPLKLIDGKIRIPANVWFVGTINIDDSTFTVSDKVYDRALVIDFKEMSNRIKCKCSFEPWPLTTNELMNQFSLAMSKYSSASLTREYNKFIKLCDFVCDTFDIRIGNRIANQIFNFLPVYMSLGGTSEEGLDFLFARKIIRKLDGKYDNYISIGLNKTLKYIQNAYGKNKFKETEGYIALLRKKLS